jgi:hypothetical protein
MAADGVFHHYWSASQQFTWTLPCYRVAKCRVCSLLSWACGWLGSDRVIIISQKILTPSDPGFHSHRRTPLEIPTAMHRNHGVFLPQAATITLPRRNFWRTRTPSMQLSYRWRKTLLPHTLSNFNTLFTEFVTKTCFCQQRLTEKRQITGVRRNDVHSNTTVL